MGQAHLVHRSPQIAPYVTKAFLSHSVFLLAQLISYLKSKKLCLLAIFSIFFSLNIVDSYFHAHSRMCKKRVESHRVVNPAKSSLENFIDFSMNTGFLKVKFKYIMNSIYKSFLSKISRIWVEKNSK